ncbi:MbtH family protein [Actinocorallia sp. A-T 12471]|uniref:MbtH family protein n=1 Tax=Actinocorallia sp. A-T 12471 TaxID=3089813 RepID=UPI0029D0243E|nr:MbtH family protein [Actinocorallia sp. A-T 12471]MDX6744048.1 MbtH family protein [Actinocorallia sp. A-T 12471]
MSTNPFDDENGTFLVLVNAEGQHSLWPVFAGTPEGWTAAHGPDTRAACLEYVERNWTNMRPASLVAAMAEDRTA